MRLPEAGRDGQLPPAVETVGQQGVLQWKRVMSLASCEAVALTVIRQSLSFALLEDRINGKQRLGVEAGNLVLLPDQALLSFLGLRNGGLRLGQFRGPLSVHVMGEHGAAEQ